MSIPTARTSLSDTLINRVLADHTLLQRYLDTEKAFQEKKFPLKDALRVANDIKALATKELIEMVWHSIDKVKRLYAEYVIDLGDIAEVAKPLPCAITSCIGTDTRRTGTERATTAADINAVIEAVRVLSLPVELL